jgi:hypothetical protein
MTHGRSEHPEVRAHVVRRLVGQARARACRSNLEFDLDVEHVERMMERQNYRCAVSGVLFSLEAHPGSFVRHPYGPSLDRVSCRRGYTRDNVRLVCVATNFGLGQWGDEVFLSIARGVVERAGAVTAHVPADLLKERIAGAEAVLPQLSEPERRKQRRRIAGLRRALTLGPDGLKEAAHRAIATKRRLVLEPSAGTRPPFGHILRQRPAL